MHFVDEEDGRTPVRTAKGDGLADVLHARKDRRQGDELGIEGVGHQPRDGRLADARRPPEDQRMWLARLEGETQRLFRPEQMALADHIVDRRRTAGAS